MQTIKKIIAEAGEECNIDVEILDSTLAKLPAEMYLNLYQKMHMRIYGYPPIVNYGGCCDTIGDVQENNISYSDSLKESECKDSPLANFTEFPRDRV